MAFETWKPDVVVGVDFGMTGTPFARLVKSLSDIS